MVSAYWPGWAIWTEGFGNVVVLIMSRPIQKGETTMKRSMRGRSWSFITNRGAISFTIATALMVMLLTAVGSVASADVLDFEDLDPGYEANGPIPRGYHGFAWSSSSSWWMTKNYLRRVTGYKHGTKGRVSLYTGGARDLSLSADGLFDFSGAYITSAWNETQEVVVEGWLGRLRVYTKTITTHNDRAYWFDFNFTNIDTLWFRPMGSHIVIDDITFGPPVIEVDIDIKPGSDPNSINLGSNGVLPVAILSTDDFDALDVDAETVLFGDPETPAAVSAVRFTLEDVDGDEDLDLLLFFSVAELDLCGALDKDSQEALLSGETFDGIPIIGGDSVRIVPPKGKGKSGK